MEKHKLKVLWITNIILPIIAEKIDKPVSVYGGWLDAISKMLFESNDFLFISVFPDTQVISGEIANNKYYTFSINNKAYQLESKFFQIILNEKPDIIHIFGTEFPHSLYMARAAREAGLLHKVIVNIQGIISICAKHYLEGVPANICKRYTLRELVKQDNLNQQKAKFEKRGVAEIKLLQIVENVIGRTDFDKACSYQFNPRIRYYFCAEVLRDVFYIHQWDINRCIRHTIFISQANYALKGFHWVVKAVKLLYKEFPDIKVYVAGEVNFIKSDIFSKLKRTSYQTYIRKMINAYGIEDCFVFLGSLDAKKMCQQYLKSNVFISASNLENSSNSISEAMLLGMPIVASDVGGTSSMLVHKKEGFLYPVMAPYMLAYYVSVFFKDDIVANTFAENARERALERHNKEKIYEKTCSIYADMQMK